MHSAHHRLRCLPRRQEGVALVLALVFLLLLTLLGISALGTTSLEEKMAHNVKDRNLAFQAAESALSLGENWIYTQIGKPPLTYTGMYEPSTGATPVWDSVNWSSGSGVVTYPGTPDATASGGLAKIQSQPKYLIEDIGEIQESGGSLTMSSTYKGKGTTIMRITARGTGGTDAAVVMVQSTFARDF